MLVAIYYLCAMLVTVKHVCNSNLSENHAKIMFAIVSVSVDRKLLFLTEISNYHFQEKQQQFTVGGECC